MDRRRELGEFLRTKRASTPVPPGSLFPVHGRRVPGLRRDEVAELALISETYYTKLERGKVPGISVAVLDGLTGALGLTRRERDYVASLIPVAGLMAPATTEGDAVTPELQRLLDSLGDVPAHLHNERADIIAANARGRALYPWHYQHTNRPNTIEFLFLDAHARDFFVNWTLAAREAVHFLRTHLAEDPTNPGVCDLVHRLRTASTEFAQVWESHDVRYLHSGVRELNHPTVGRLTIDFHGLQPLDHDRLRLMIYTAEPGSATAQRFSSLV